MSDNYSEYLQTDEWQMFVSYVKEKRYYRCEFCRARNCHLDVHHKTYERLGRELPRDVYLVCRRCHGFIHAVHKARGGSLRRTSQQVRLAVREVAFRKYSIETHPELQRMFQDAGFVPDWDFRYRGFGNPPTDAEIAKEFEDEMDELANPWHHPDWQLAARESLEASIANSPPPVTGARNFWEACRKVDARNVRNQRLPEEPQKPIPQSTIDATLWLRKFHPERLPGWYAKHPGLEKHLR